MKKSEVCKYAIKKSSDWYKCELTSPKGITNISCVVCAETHEAPLEDFALTNCDVRIRNELKKMEKEKMKDDKTDVEIEISDEDFLFWAKEAHKRDITINQMINEALKKMLEEENV